MHRIVSARETRRNRALLFVGASLLVAMSIVVGWLLGRSGALAYDYSSNLQRSMNQLQTENASLQEQLTSLNTLSNLGEETDNHLQLHLQNLNETNLRLQKENSFLREILEPSASRTLTIRDLELYPTVEDYAYDYSFTLTGNLEKAMRGQLTISVSGELNGELVVLSMTEITRPDMDKLSYRFNYLQVIKGRIWLPEDFIPQLLIVEEASTSGNGSSPKHLFNWILRENI